MPGDAWSLPRLPQPGGAVIRWRPVARVLTAPRVVEIGGTASGSIESGALVVRRPIPGVEPALADPFLLFDHPETPPHPPAVVNGTAWQPQRGFDTVGYLGGQLWVKVSTTHPSARAFCQEIDPDRVTRLGCANGDTLIRVIAGRLGEHRGPAQTRTPIVYAHASVPAGSRFTLHWPPEFNALLYAISGRGHAGVAERPVEAGQLAVFGPGGALRLRAAWPHRGEAAATWEVLLLGGLPQRESPGGPELPAPRTRQEILQAMADYQAGRLGVIPPSSRRSFSSHFPPS